MGSTRILASTAIIIASTFGACRCNDLPQQNIYEVGIPLEAIPQSARKELAEFLPSQATMALAVREPVQPLWDSLRHDPLIGKVGRELALSDWGTTARTLLLRLHECSGLPDTKVGWEAILDSPWVGAVKLGTDEQDFILIKRLSPHYPASWKMAKLLQAVSSSTYEVRIERYQGFPLRKVLFHKDRRITFFILRDLLVMGTSDSWVKTSLELAIGKTSPNPIPPSLINQSTNRKALCSVVLNAEALRAEPGRPGLLSLSLLGVRWLRADYDLPQGWTVQLKLTEPWRKKQTSTRSAWSQFATRSTLIALSRTLDLSAALHLLLPSPSRLPVSSSTRTISSPLDEESQNLREKILRFLAPHLGTEVFWLFNGFANEERLMVARHVLGIELKDPRAFGLAWTTLSSQLLSGPIITLQDENQTIICSSGQDLCTAVVDNVFLISNRLESLRTALASQPPSWIPPPELEEASDFAFFDGPGLASTLRNSIGLISKSKYGVDPGEIHERIEPILKILHFLGSRKVHLRPQTPMLISGKIVPP